MNEHSLPPLTVSQLTNAIKHCLEPTFPNVHLQGEVSNLKIQSSGHIYFTLKDADAQIAAVMFKGDASLLKNSPKSGDQVIVKAGLSVYPPKGNYQLIVRELAYVGIGELLQKLEVLKLKLHQMGWFKQARKKPLPKFPKKIGVVTSPTGAVIQDIINVLTRRFGGFQLILYPVKVQGEGAAEEIAQAIEQMNRFQLVDVMIVGRGGGSLEDLWAFNEEIVAKAIFQSVIPIISAVGHETDHCIADYVADVRAPTPSAAAEIVIAEKNQHLEFLQVLKKRMRQTVAHQLIQMRSRLSAALKHPFIAQPNSFLEWRMQKLDDFRFDLELSMRGQLQLKKQKLEGLARLAYSLKPANQLSQYKKRLEQIKGSLQQHFKQRLAKEKKNLSHIQELLKSLNPKNVLQKGYSIVLAEKGSVVINSIAKLNNGDQVRILLSDGEAIATICQIINN